MGDEYKQQISEKIKDSINQWIEDLKVKHPELLLTKQWKVTFPKGFTSGHIVIPVVTNSKKGKHLVGEVQFMLPPSLELDYDSIELVLKNEPFKESRKKNVSSTPPLDDSLDVLNDLIIGLNSFLTNISAPMINSQQRRHSLFVKTDSKINSQPINIINGSANVNSSELGEVKRQIFHSAFKPDWMNTIDSNEVVETLIHKMAEALIHYRKKAGYDVSIKDFFEKYSEHLVSQNKLYHHCKYKASPVKLDSNKHCQESYCSKKPYNSECPHTTLKFGTI